MTLLTKNNIQRTFRFVWTVVLFAMMGTLSSNVAAQSVDHLNWNTKYGKMVTENFEVFYVKGLGNSDLAKRIAIHLEVLRPIEGDQLDTRTVSKRYHVILQPYSQVSNAFVNGADEASEFFLTPIQRFHTQSVNWLDALAVHEYRHMVQYTAFQKSGYLNTIRKRFGPAFSGTLTSSHLHNWLTEGDAVDIETRLTTGGRGESSQFIAVYRANLMQREKPLTYDQSQLLTVRYRLPADQHYVHGYLMTRYIKNHVGDEVFNKIISRASKRSYFPATVSRSLKYYTGKNMLETYRAMNDSLKSEWSKPKYQQTTERKEDQIVPVNAKNVSLYQYPVETNDGIIMMLTGFRDNPRLVKYNNGDASLSKLDRVGEILPQVLPITGDKNGIVYYLELFFPARRYKDLLNGTLASLSSVSYARLVKYNSNTKVRETLDNTTRYTSVSINPEGDKLLVLRRNMDMSHTLMVHQTGREILTIPNHQLLKAPRWSSDGKSIVAVFGEGNQDSIVKIDPETGDMTTLEKSKSMYYRYPYLRGDELFFISTTPLDRDNVFLKDLKTQEIYQITESKFGVENFLPLKNNKEILYIPQSTDGDYPHKLTYKRSKKASFAYEDINPKLKIGEGKTVMYADVIKDHKDDIIVEQQDVAKMNTPGIRPRSWLMQPTDIPLIFNGFRTFKVGISAKDRLNFLTAGASYQFGKSTDELKSGGKTHTIDDLKNDQFSANLGYEGFNLGTVQLKYDNSTFDTVKDDLLREYKVNTLSLGLAIPIWRRIRHYQGSLSFTPKVQYDIVDTDISNPFSEAVLKTESNYDLTSVNGKLSFAITRKAHQQALTSRLGFNIDYSFGGVWTTSGDNKGTFDRTHIIATKAFLPGFLANDSFSFYYSYLSGQLPNYQSGLDYSPYDADNTDLKGVGYRTPLLFPDISIWSLVFLKKLNLEVSALNDNTKSKTFYRTALVFDYVPIRSKTLAIEFNTIGLAYTITDHNGDTSGQFGFVLNFQF